MGVTNFSQINPEFTSGTAVANAVTINSQTGNITTENLTTAQNATYLCTLTNSRIQVGSSVMATVGYGSATVGSPVLQKVLEAAGSVAITIINLGTALNGTLDINFWVLNPTAP